MTLRINRRSIAIMMVSWEWSVSLSVDALVWDDDTRRLQRHWDVSELLLFQSILHPSRRLLLYWLQLCHGRRLQPATTIHPSAGTYLMPPANTYPSMLQHQTIFISAKCTDRVNGTDTVFIRCVSVCVSVHSSPVNQTNFGVKYHSTFKIQYFLFYFYYFIF